MTCEKCFSSAVRRTNSFAENVFVPVDLPSQSDYAEGTRIKIGDDTTVIIKKQKINFLETDVLWAVLRNRAPFSNNDLITFVNNLATEISQNKLGFYADVIFEIGEVISSFFSPQEVPSLIRHFLATPDQAAPPNSRAIIATILFCLADKETLLQLTKRIIPNHQNYPENEFTDDLWACLMRRYLSSELTETEKVDFLNWLPSAKRKWQSLGEAALYFDCLDFLPRPEQLTPEATRFYRQIGGKDEALNIKLDLISGKIPKAKTRLDFYLGSQSNASQMTEALAFYFSNYPFELKEKILENTIAAFLTSPTTDWEQEPYQSGRKKLREKLFLPENAEYLAKLQDKILLDTQMLRQLSPQTFEDFFRQAPNQAEIQIDSKAAGNWANLAKLILLQRLLLPPESSPKTTLFKHPPVSDLEKKWDSQVAKSPHATLNDERYCQTLLDFVGHFPELQDFLLPCWQKSPPSRQPLAAVFYGLWFQTKNKKFLDLAERQMVFLEVKLPCLPYLKKSELIDPFLEKIDQCVNQNEKKFLLEMLIKDLSYKENIKPNESLFPQEKQNQAFLKIILNSKPFVIQRLWADIWYLLPALCQSKKQVQNIFYLMCQNQITPPKRMFSSLVKIKKSKF